MTTVPPFCAKHWLKENCKGGKNLDTTTIEVVSDFTLMWNFFEGELCHSNARISYFEEISNSVPADLSLPEEVEKSIQFWTQRYTTASGFNSLFKGLNLRQHDGREHVESVLRGIKTDVPSKLLAVMIIIYRLRNNLFHGLKEIGTLNDQVQNLTVSCGALAKILELSGRDIVNVAKG